MKRDAAGDQPHDPSLSEQVREIIRERIIRGQYEQDSRISEAGLADELEVSRLPLRAAIPQLQASGFVSTAPRRAARVFSWTPAAVHDLFDARLAIEVAAAGYAARQDLTDSPALAAVRRVMDRSYDAVASGDLYEFATTSALFHQRFVDLAGNGVLSAAMRSVEGRMNWLFYLASGNDSPHAEEEHETLCRTILSGNVDLARALTHAHIDASREPILAAMANRERD